MKSTHELMSVKNTNPRNECLGCAMFHNYWKDSIEADIGCNLAQTVTKTNCINDKLMYKIIPIKITRD